jgi:hypothetical protein
MLLNANDLYGPVTNQSDSTDIRSTSITTPFRTPDTYDSPNPLYLPLRHALIVLTSSPGR